MTTKGARGDDFRDTNRALWDAWTEVNAGSDFYDLESFRAGASSLKAVELEELGDVVHELPVRPCLCYAFIEEVEHGKAVIRDFAGRRRGPGQSYLRFSLKVESGGPSEPSMCTWPSK